MFQLTGQLWWLANVALAVITAILHRNQSKVSAIPCSNNNLTNVNVQVYTLITKVILGEEGKGFHHLCLDIYSK